MDHSDSSTGHRRPRLPDTPEERDILRMRAQQLAVPKINKHQNSMEEWMLHVRLDTDAHYGVSYRFVEEIIPVGSLTPVPFTPKTIAGVVNRHGQLLTIIDIKWFLISTSLIPNPSSRILVVRGAGITAGILVESVEGKVKYQPDKLTAALHVSTAHANTVVVGIHQGSIAVLNMDVLLSHPALVVGERALRNKS
ncbi:MAG: chemotaxis protein CheW [Magnetococcus sp. YQC-5]